MKHIMMTLIAAFSMTLVPAVPAHGQASTDYDANRCISNPRLVENDTFRGSTSATITNDCDDTIDVRIYLMRSGGWNCGVRWGVEPGEDASYSSFQATGEVFVDARVADSDLPLAKPRGY